MINIKTIQVIKGKEQQMKEWTSPKTQETIIFYTQSLWCKLPYKKPVYINFTWKAKDPFDEQAILSNVDCHCEQYKNNKGVYITLGVIDKGEKYQATTFTNKKKDEVLETPQEKVAKLEKDEKLEQGMDDFLHNDTSIKNDKTDDTDLDFLDSNNEKKENE